LRGQFATREINGGGSPDAQWRGHHLLQQLGLAEPLDEFFAALRSHAPFLLKSGIEAMNHGHPLLSLEVPDEGDAKPVIEPCPRISRNPSGDQEPHGRKIGCKLLDHVAHLLTVIQVRNFVKCVKQQPGAVARD